MKYFAGMNVPKNCSKVFFGHELLGRRLDNFVSGLYSIEIAHVHTIQHSNLEIL